MGKSRITTLWNTMRRCCGAMWGMIHIHLHSKLQGGDLQTRQYWTVAAAALLLLLHVDTTAAAAAAAVGASGCIPSHSGW